MTPEPPGRARLIALCESWLDYHRREVMPGGCFLTTATVEFDARPGPLRDAIGAAMKLWLSVVEREAAVAIENEELPADLDPADLAFHLNALAAAASYGYQLWRPTGSGIGDWPVRRRWPCDAIVSVAARVSIHRRHCLGCHCRRR